MGSTTVTYEYEYWDCGQCGNKRLRGDVETCSSCGKPRGDGVKFYAVDGAEAVEADGVAAAEAGPDWECSNCKTYCAATLTSCRSCGADREGSDRGYFEARQTARHKRESFRQASSSPSEERAEAGMNAILGGPSRQEPYRYESRSRQGDKSSLIVAAGIILAICIAAIVLHEKPLRVDYLVQGGSWTREIDVERLVEKEMDDWEGETRGENVQVLSEKSEFHHKDRFVDHYRTETYTDRERYRSGSHESCSTSRTSLGNGRSKTTKSCHTVPDYSYRNVTKTRQEPVYGSRDVFKKKLHYRARLWEHFTTAKAAGSGPGQRAWPEIPAGEGAGGAKDRAGSKHEAYTLSVKIAPDAPKEAADKGYAETATISVDEAAYARLLNAERATLVTDSGRDGEKVLVEAPPEESK